VQQTLIHSWKKCVNANEDDPNVFEVHRVVASYVEVYEELKGVKIIFDSGATHHMFPSKDIYSDNQFYNQMKNQFQLLM
jgi:hypothetical protein